MGMAEGIGTIHPEIPSEDLLANHLQEGLLWPHHRNVRELNANKQLFPVQPFHKTRRSP